MQRPDDPLVSLVWNGAFSTTQNHEQCHGRYAWRDLHAKADVQDLLDRQYAKKTHGSVIVPTRAGIEEAARRYPRSVEEPNEKLAMLGLRSWELRETGDTPLIGIYFTLASGTSLLQALSDGLNLTPRPISVLLTTIGGILPSALANDLSGTELEDAPNYELVALPPNLKNLTNILHEYEFILDIRLRNGTAILFLTSGFSTYYLAPLTIRALVNAASSSSPQLAELATKLDLDKALAEHVEQPSLDPLL